MPLTNWRDTTLMQYKATETVLGNCTNTLYPIYFPENDFVESFDTWWNAHKLFIKIKFMYECIKEFFKIAIVAERNWQCTYMIEEF